MKFSSSITAVKLAVIMPMLATVTCALPMMPMNETTALVPCEEVTTQMPVQRAATLDRSASITTALPMDTTAAQVLRQTQHSKTHFRDLSQVEHSKSLHKPTHSQDRLSQATHSETLHKPTHAAAHAHKPIIQTPWQAAPKYSGLPIRLPGGLQVTPVYAIETRAVAVPGPTGHHEVQHPELFEPVQSAISGLDQRQAIVPEDTVGKIYDVEDVPPGHLGGPGYPYRDAAEQLAIDRASIGYCDRSYKLVMEAYNFHLLTEEEIQGNGDRFNVLANKCGIATHFHAKKDPASLHFPKSQPQYYEIGFNLPLSAEHCINAELGHLGFPFRC